MSEEAFTYPVYVHELLVSASHSYFGNQTGEPKDIPMKSMQTIVADAGMGIRGDRFYNRKPDYDGQITLVSREVFDDVRELLSIPDANAALMRRNVIISGVPLNQLIGLRFGLGPLILEGSGHCAPCKWMDIAIAPGALRLLNGRGGLRCKVLQGGVLAVGTNRLSSPVSLDLTTIREPLPARPLP